MFIVIKENVVGVVENSKIVRVYDRSESISDIYNDNVEQIESDLIGEYVTGNEIVKLNCTDERCRLDRSLGEEDTVSPDTEATSINLLQYI